MSNMYLPEVSITDAVSKLSMIYTPLIKGKLPLDSIPSPFLWGPPGIGKSDGVRQLAKSLEENTGKNVKVTDIRLLLFSPIDLRGVPVADKTRSFTDWLKPRILELDESSDVINILFLDELSAAPQSVQASAYQITLNRAIGEHKLPANTIVIAAGNRTIDRAIAYKMPSPLANRMMHFEIGVDFQSWSKWAIENGNVNPLVLGYLSYDINKLYPEEVNIDEVAFPTPRSWMFVSNILNTIDETEDIERYHTILAGCIGTGTAVEFIAWTKIYKTLPKTEDIFAGKVIDFKGTPDALYALISSMTTFATRHEKDENTGGLSTGQLENACRFANTLPADYAASFYLHLLSFEGLKLKLMKSPSFMTWGKQHRRILAASSQPMSF